MILTQVCLSPAIIVTLLCQLCTMLPIGTNYVFGIVFFALRYNLIGCFTIHLVQLKLNKLYRRHASLRFL
jgi:hypothetical protein